VKLLHRSAASPSSSSKRPRKRGAFQFQPPYSSAVEQSARPKLKLDAARQRLHESVILGMKTWIREETRRGLRAPRTGGERGVRFHFEVLERFREEERRRRAEQHFTL
jgi:hypothetical protein